MIYYHIYNRGAHKAHIFHNTDDYWRFVSLLYVVNDTKPVVFKLIKSNVFDVHREKPLINIFAYCLMPNHFHIGIASEQPEEVTIFMRKLCTAYGMYYNTKYMHSGTIFQGKYKSKILNTEEYFEKVIEYIHLNPFGIEEPDLLREAKYEQYDRALEYSKLYEFSSFKDYLGEKRKQGVILSKVGPWKHPSLNI